MNNNNTTITFIELQEWLDGLEEENCSVEKVVSNAQLLILFLLFGMKRNLTETISEQMLGKFIRKRGVELLRLGAIGNVTEALKRFLGVIENTPMFEQMEQAQLEELQNHMKSLQVLLNLAFILVSVAMVEKNTSVHDVLGIGEIWMLLYYLSSIFV